MRDIAGKAWQENEKRCKRRFPIERELCYRILKNGRPAESGTGLTLDVSSGGIRFTCEQALPVDAKVEITMSWPATLENSCPLQLVGMGRMVRSEGA